MGVLFFVCLFALLIVPHFLSVLPLLCYSSQDAPQLLADGSALPSPWQQTVVAEELLQAKCCELQEIVEKMVRFILLSCHVMISA